MIQEKIAGIHNYCNRWCERCPFQERCDVFQDIKAFEAGTHNPPEITMVDHWAGLDFEMTPDEKAVAERRRGLREHLTAIHPISVRCRAYINAVRTAPAAILQNAPSNDPILNLARDTVRMHSLPIASKARRAVHELVDADDEAVDRAVDPRGVQSDGNGSAKVVRLLIGESIAAWRVVEDHAGDHRDAAAMIRLLGMLDAELDRAFPFAMEFVRPGFDEGAESP